jgi:hypothetical protein
VPIIADHQFRFFNPGALKTGASRQDVLGKPASGKENNLAACLDDAVDEIA